MREAVAALAEAYRSAVYTVDTGSGPLVLRVDAPDPALDALLAAHGCATAARLTAANPGSCFELSAAANEAANARLRLELGARGFAWLPCHSAAPDGSWPEAGYLVLGIGRQAAEELARRFGQRGLLWIERDAPVALVMV